MQLLKIIYVENIQQYIIIHNLKIKCRCKSIKAMNSLTQKHINWKKGRKLYFKIVLYQNNLVWHFHPSKLSGIIMIIRNCHLFWLRRQPPTGEAGNIGISFPASPAAQEWTWFRIHQWHILAMTTELERSGKHRGMSRCRKTESVGGVGPAEQVPVVNLQTNSVLWFEVQLLATWLQTWFFI